MIQAIAKTPWAITADGLELILGIAQRKISDTDLALSISAARSKNIESGESSNISMRDGVAVLNIIGSIFPRADFFTDISGATTIENLSSDFSKALQDEKVKAIVLNIDSPGGQITGIHEFANKIYNSRGTKPIHAYISALGASAAYWIATAADKVSVDATAMVGSIGVVAAWTDNSKAKEADGYQDYTVVSSQSPNKRLDPKTEKGKELLQKELDDLANVFISDVARNREVSVETVLGKFGQGGLLIASEAIKVGMADNLSNLEDVVSNLKYVSYSQIGATLVNSDKEVLVEATEVDDLISSDSLENKSDNKTPPPPANAEINEAKLLASNPKLYNALMQKGAAQERERIKSIDAMSAVVGDKKLLEEAKYTNPCSAEQLAYKIVKAESDLGRKFSTDYAEDKAVLNGIQATTEISGETSFDADVNAIVKGVKGNG